ncbi:zinc knuckle-domain-containing protein [Aspergillus granulosus]|uniref:Zinc knuckle-domain-containing protein n=1 Tax=Aspergillus granulosus TaxID=176169 RepID=A0ABR4GSY4_9EURO
MNRYRNAPGVRGPSKATASTLCQKCLKRGHYSYECKVTAQERPYLARPSRTQQLQNPKLRPQLTTDVPDGPTRTKGTADALLAQREEERGRRRDLDESEPRDSRGLTSERTRSISSVSGSSVSTISTNRSRSASPRRGEGTRGRRAKSLTSHHSFSRKRRHSDSSSGYSVSSYSSKERSRSRSPERNIRRRRRESSPKERGRPRNMSRDDDRRDRNKSRSRNIDKNRNTRGRRSVTPEKTIPERSYATRSPSIDKLHVPYNEKREDGRNRPFPRRERSLSPYSKRLALTQAMNMGH